MMFNNDILDIKNRLNKLEQNQFNPNDYEGIVQPWDCDDKPFLVRVKISKKENKCPNCGQCLGEK